MLVGSLVVAGVGCGVVGSAVSLGLSRGIVWGSGVGGGLSDWMRAGSCWRLCLYWSSTSVEWSAAGGIGGAAEVSGVPMLRSVVVRSMVGLLGKVVLVSTVLVLSMVVPGLSFVSVVVGANVEMTGSGAWSWGGSWLLCAVRWLDGSLLADLWDGMCWAVRKQAQSSLVVRHWNAGGAGMWIRQCW